MSRNQHLINESALREWTGYERQADIEKWLDGLGIRPLRGKAGQLMTTLEQINDALLRAGKPAANFDEFEFVKDGKAQSH